ncbi:MAG: hypothetical protein RR313_11280 [Anaerovoracaceae bacterium]
MKNEISLSKYCYFDKEMGKFYLTNEASNIIYRKKNIICSYSGINDWANHFVCEMIDLYSGRSKYNYALGTVVHENGITELRRTDDKSLFEWVLSLTERDWSIAMFKAFDNIIDTLVAC